jgi:hypothetical protein
MGPYVISPRWSHRRHNVNGRAPTGSVASMPETLVDVPWSPVAVHGNPEDVFQGLYFRSIVAPAGGNVRGDVKANSAKGKTFVNSVRLVQVGSAE